MEGRNREASVLVRKHIFWLTDVLFKPKQTVRDRYTHQNQLVLICTCTGYTGTLLQKDSNTHAVECKSSSVLQLRNQLKLKHDDRYARINFCESEINCIMI